MQPLRPMNASQLARYDQDMAASKKHLHMMIASLQLAMAYGQNEADLADAFFAASAECSQAQLMSGLWTALLTLAKGRG